ncbi:MAG: hypothetical protein V4494_01100 [Chlamydiota bacterium]
MATYHIKALSIAYGQTLVANQEAENAINHVMTNPDASLENAQKAIAKRDNLINTAEKLFAEATKRKLSVQEQQDLGTLQHIFRTTNRREYKQITTSFKKAVVEVEIRKKANEAKQHMQSILNHLQQGEIDQIDQDLIFNSRVLLTNNEGRPYEKYDDDLATQIADELKNQLTSALEEYENVTKELQSDNALSLIRISELEKDLAKIKTKVKGLLNLIGRLEKKNNKYVSSPIEWIFSNKYNFSGIDSTPYKNALQINTLEKAKQDNYIINFARNNALAKAAQEQPNAEIKNESISSSSVATDVVAEADDNDDDVVPDLPENFVYEPLASKKSSKKTSLWGSFKAMITSLFSCFKRRK